MHSTRRYLRLILLMLLEFHAHAIVPCAYSRVSQFRNFEDLRTNARWIKDHEPHTNLTDKINGVVAKKFLAATGSLICNGKPYGSANLVCGGKVLVLAAHLFHVPHESCNFAIVPESCSFRLSGSKETADIPIEKMQKMGTTCSNGTRADLDHDWAVVTLTKSAANNPQVSHTSVQPYALGKPDEVKIGQPLIAACAFSGDVVEQDKASGKFGRPKTWSFGSKEEELNNGQNKGLWSASVSASFGCSGGGLINSDHELLAIAIHTGEQPDEVDKLGKRWDLNFHETPCVYTPAGDCRTYWLPIKGDFATAAQAACDIPAK